MVYRIYTERRNGFTAAADKLKKEITELLRIDSVRGVRVFNRYDAEDITAGVFEACIPTVFSEPQTDETYCELPEISGRVFAVEYLPGQFDQRADSCAQCIQLAFGGERPTVRTARVYAIEGDISEDELCAIKKYVINPVESREADFSLPLTLKITAADPADIPVLDGFTRLDAAGLNGVIDEYRLAMDGDDIACCRDYFLREGRDPTLTELRMLDTYWSDHCRHTTFGTVIESVVIDDPAVLEAYERYMGIKDSLGRGGKPVTLMELATIGARWLRKNGLLDRLDESEEINACTIKIKADIDGKQEDWLLLFKNETHNHPTEIEPFGGAATCIGGAIRDPLSGRAYVYQAMRVTGAADPTRPISETLPGKLPQRKLVTEAANGYSSYGNQIGLATGLVDEIYHDGYAAKRMEIGAVIGAVPQKCVRREVPEPGDIVVLLGGRTGRDGCGGATGSSKSHSLSSLEQCGAEVQKGNAPEERKLQRLFRNRDAAHMIKRCNDFGAGGVSVAIGELADGIVIDLDRVPKKYDGLDGTELAISESQERMAVVLSPSDVDAFCSLAADENLEATVVAEISKTPRLVMKWRGRTIVDISREFIDSAGARKYACVHIGMPSSEKPAQTDASPAERLESLASDLNVCSKRGLSERFDSTIGAGTLLMPFGGKYMRTPPQAMAALLPADGETDTCSVMAYGFNPFLSERNPFAGAYNAVVESVSKVIASGGKRGECCLTFQEYFERLGKSSEKWGKPFSALLGALSAQLDLSVAAIGGKDSMSGSFEDISVPPTLVSFAVATAKAGDIISPEFKRAGSRVVLLRGELPAVMDEAERLISSGAALSAFTPGYGGIAAGLMKSCFGNRIGIELDGDFDTRLLFEEMCGAFVLELAPDAAPVGALIGMTTEEYTLCKVSLDRLERIYESRLAEVFPTRCPAEAADIENTRVRAASHKVSIPAAVTGRPRVLVPVFPGTNCEYDTVRAFEKAGAQAQTLVVRNLNARDIEASAAAMEESIRSSQIVFIPGGFSGGDEPDGSGKFITAFFRSPGISDAITQLLEQRGGLVGGICNGFQALIKLGLVPFGRITDATADSPTLTYNTIGRHQSMLVRTRIESTLSPWLSECSVGDIHTVPVSHGEGRFICPPELLETLAANGQIATRYVGNDGCPSMDIDFNPNGSLWAVEGITSPDGRVFGKMGHSERTGGMIYKNIPGNYDNGMFRSAVKYFR